MVWNNVPKLTRYCRVTLFVFTVSSGLLAQRVAESGTQFLKTCSTVERIEPGKQTGSSLADAKACEAYVIGVIDGVEIQHIWSKSHGDPTAADFCIEIPATQTDSDATDWIRTVLRYIRENPDRAQFRSVVVVTEALHRAFPCAQ